MCCIPRTLRDVRTELKVARESVRDEFREVGHSMLACSQAAYFSMGFRT